MLLFLTLLVAVSWYLHVAARSSGSLPTRVVLAGIGATGQIVVTLTLLGAIGRLSPAVAGLATTILCCFLLAAVARPAGDFRALPGILRRDITSLRAGAAAALAWETVALAIVLGFAGLWIATSIAFYPPRGIDDVTYHLPPIYQAVQDRAFVLLPVELRGHFAYPLNGELLFLWIPLFTGGIRWIDGPQAVLGGLGAVAVFALGRRFSLSARGAVLASALFALMPVSLLQAPSNYVDLISSTWLLSAVVALSHYRETGARLGLALGGLAVGLLAGTKASTLPLVALLAAFAAVTLARRTDELTKRMNAAALFFLAAVAAGGYWYLRNWIVLGNPIYPYPFRVLGATIFAGPLEIGRSAWAAILADPPEIIRIALWDPGLGSFHGGFGFLFWGFAGPAVTLQIVRAFRTDAQHRATRLLVLSLLPLGLATLFLVGHSDLFVFSRLVLVVGAPAFIAFALLVDEARGTLPVGATFLRAIAVGSAASTIVLMASARWPLMNLAPLASIPGHGTSELIYLARAPWDLRFMAAAWAPLDAITRDGAGLTVYQASDWPVFWTAPTYGTQLQNRIWNFARDSRDPQAFLFHAWSGTPFYVTREIRRETVAADPQFRLVASETTDVTTLYVSHAALAEHGRGGRLADYYRVMAPDLVQSTQASLSRLEPGGVLLASFPFARGYIVHEADGRLRAELYPIVMSDVDRLAAQWPTRVIYTIGHPLAGRTGTIVAKIQLAESTFALYRNVPIVELGILSP